MIHYKNKRSNHFFWPTLVILCLLILFSYRNPVTSSLPSKALNVIVSPLNSAFFFGSQKVQTLYNRIFGDRATQAEVARLKEENAKYLEKITQLEQVVGQSEALKNYADLLQIAPEKAIQAHVSAMDSSNRFVRFTVNKGTKDGVRDGDIIVEGTKDPKSMVVKSLVGKVMEAGPNYAKVSSLQDQASNISVMFSGSGGYGIVNNRDDENYYGYLLDPTIALKNGEAALSSGIGGVYPRGLYIGKVSHVETAEDGLTKKFTITSSVNFNQLYWVLVLHPEEIDQDMRSLNNKEDVLPKEKENQTDQSNPVHLPEQSENESKESGASDE